MCVTISLERVGVITDCVGFRLYVCGYLFITFTPSIPSELCEQTLFFFASASVFLLNVPVASVKRGYVRVLKWEDICV